MISKLSAVCWFAALVVVANWATHECGLVPVGWGFAVTAGTFAAGLVLLVRDWVHEAGGRRWVACAVFAGALLSAILSEPRLAVASGVAFAVSELADFAVYAPLRRRSFAAAAGLSNTVGAVVDSLLFLTLAGFPLWPGAGVQSVVKVAVTLPFIALVVVGRALLRDRVRAEGA